MKAETKKAERINPEKKEAGTRKAGSISPEKKEAGIGKAGGIGSAKEERESAKQRSEQMREKDSSRSVREKLLESAKNEFLRWGYEKASLRRISAGAGVTTGAVYFFFANKAELFEQVVGETVKMLAELSREMAKAELENPEVGVDNENRLLEFFWRNKQCMTILMEKAQGTKYENFETELERQLETVFELFFRKYGVERADRDLIHILVKMKIQGYRAMMEGDYSLDRLLELSAMVGQYADDGFKGLITRLSTKK